jgi:hypothetical protein
MSYSVNFKLDQWRKLFLMSKYSSMQCFNIFETQESTWIWSQSSEAIWKLKNQFCSGLGPIRCLPPSASPLPAAIHTPPALPLLWGGLHEPVVRLRPHLHRADDRWSMLPSTSSSTAKLLTIARPPRWVSNHPISPNRLPMDPTCSSATPSLPLRCRPTGYAGELPHGGGDWGSPILVTRGPKGRIGWLPL